MPTNKQCRKCAEIKPLDDFYRNRGTYASRCKACVKAEAVERRLTPEGKVTAERSARARRLRTKYGLTIGDYDALLATQGGVCAACGRKDPRGQLAVDHHHASGVVRGLLCRACNLMLGYARSDASVLRAGAAYLESK